jgi:hypothetical protein
MKMRIELSALMSAVGRLSALGPARVPHPAGGRPSTRRTRP